MARGVKDWGHDLQVGLDALAEAESQAFGQDLAPRRFRKIDRWLIAADAVPRWPWPPGDKLGIILRASGLGTNWLRFRLPFAPTVLLRSSADAVLLKANLRSFHIAGGVTLKVANPGRRTGRERLHHEASSRQNLRATQHARVPALMRPVRDRGEGFLAEELVIGHPPTRADIDAGDLAGWLFAFYAANDMRGRPIVDLCDPDADWTVVSDYARRVDLQISPQLGAAMAELVNEATVPQALSAAAICNGDLTFSNMILQDGCVVLIDWEYATNAPVFFDAVRLTAQLPEFADSFLAVFAGSAIARQPGMLSGRKQFLIACAMAAQQRIARVGDFEFAGDRTAYDRRLQGRIAKILALMERLCRLAG